MVRLPCIAALCALLVAVVACAGSNPVISVNTKDQGRTWFYCDSVVHYNGTPIQPVRPVYLVEGVSVRGEMDSVIMLWKAGGAAPRFRRIQGIKIFPEAVTPQELTITIYHADGTSANNKYISPGGEVWLDIPLEADSLHISCTVAGHTNDVDICVW